MRSTRLLSTARNNLLAGLIAAAWVTTAAARASTRPQYGGTLRIELHATNLELDPRKWKAGSQDFATSEHFAALLFDRLVSLDNYGHFQPQLAVQWTHDASLKRWQFVLRSAVKFSDGAALNATDVAASLQTALPPEIQISAFNNSVQFQSANPIPDLLEFLASGRSFVFRQSKDGTLLGTAPFALTPEASAEAPAPFEKLRFRALEQSWAGRPFVDHIEVTLGVTPLRALFDLQLGKADLVLLAPEVVRRASQSDVRVWESDPATLYLLVADNATPTNNPGLREALSLSLDRATMAGVLLQKQAEPSASLLPRWLSGYALLFNMDLNLSRAKVLQQSLPLSAGSAADPLLLRVEVAGDLPRLIGDRVALNARQAGLFVQIITRNSPVKAPTKGSNGKGSLRLLAWRYTSLSPRAELEAMKRSLHLESETEPNAHPPESAQEWEQLYADEKALLERSVAIPLVAFPDYVALSDAVRDWTPAPWGEWRVADVWLDRGDKGATAVGDSGSAAAGARP